MQGGRQGDGDAGRARAGKAGGQVDELSPEVLAYIYFLVIICNVFGFSILLCAYCTEFKVGVLPENLFFQY